MVNRKAMTMIIARAGFVAALNTSAETQQDRAVKNIPTEPVFPSLVTFKKRITFRFASAASIREKRMPKQQ